MSFLKKLFGSPSAGSAAPAASTPRTSDAPAIRPRIDEVGQATMLFETAMDRFKQGDGEERRKALSMLIECTARFPTYTRAHCTLSRFLIQLGNLDSATQLMASAYSVNPDDEEVYKEYAGCFVRKGSRLWEAGDLTGAYEAGKTAMKIEGFNDQSFALTRQMALKTDQLEDFACHCVSLGIDPLRDFDLSKYKR